MILAHNYTYSVPHNLRASLPIFYMFVLQSLVSSPLWWQPGTTGLSLSCELVFLEVVFLDLSKELLIWLVVSDSSKPPEMKPVKMILMSEGREDKEVDLTGKTYFKAS